MADPVVTYFSVYAGTKKVAEAESSSYEGTNQGEAVYGDVPGGFITYSVGAVDTTLTVTEIVPVAGTSYDFVSALINSTPLQMALSLVDGKIHQLDMRCMQYRFDGDTKTGVLKGQFTFKGGRPTVTG